MDRMTYVVDFLTRKESAAIALEPDKANERNAFNGLCAAIIQTGREPGGIRIQADSLGLKLAAAVKIKSL